MGRLIAILAMLCVIVGGAYVVGTQSPAPVAPTAEVTAEPTAEPTEALPDPAPSAEYACEGLVEAFIEVFGATVLGDEDGILIIFDDGCGVGFGTDNFFHFADGAWEIAYPNGVVFSVPHGTPHWANAMMQWFWMQDFNSIRTTRVGSICGGWDCAFEAEFKNAQDLEAGGIGFNNGFVQGQPLGWYVMPAPAPVEPSPLVPQGQRL